MRHVLLLLVTAVVLLGCVTGPDWDPELRTPVPEKIGRDREVIVSDFLSARREVSVLMAPGIDQLLESATVHDESFTVAGLLKREGFQTQAHAGFEPGDLRDDQVLLRGAVVVTPLNSMEGIGVFNFLYLVTALPLVLPSPVPFRAGGYVLYRYELIDTDGRIIYQSGETKSRVTWKYNWLWSAIGVRNTIDRELYGGALETVVEGMAENL